MALTEQEKQIVLYGQKNGQNPQSIISALTKYRQERANLNIDSGGAPTTTTQEEPTYLQRIGKDFKEGFKGAVEDINSADNRTDFSKGVSSVANIARAVISPLVELPGFKQVADTFGKAINYTGDKISDLYSEDFKKSLTEMSDEDFNKATEVLQTTKNLGDIANAILIAKGGQKGVEGAKNLADKTKQATVEVGQKFNDAGGKVVEGVKNVAGEVIPSADRFVNEQVTKALQLTASDVRNLEASTGNVIGQFMAEHNLIGKNLAETQKLLEDFHKNNYSQVRSEIAKVRDSYKPSEVPRFKQALTELKDQIEGVAGQEGKLSEISSLLKKKSVSLEDVQRVKELIDDLHNLYKVTGDVKEGVAKQGFAIIRDDLKTFIEQKVKDSTGADIAELNNKVSTSKGIIKAAEARSTSGLTKSHWRIGDLGIFGAGSLIGSPLFGAALLLAKKVVESPAVKFRMAKYVDRLSDARKLRLQEKLAKGEAPKELQEVAQLEEGNKAKVNINNNPAKTSIEESIPQISENAMKHLNIRAVMERLETGYTHKQVVKIMENLFKKFPDGNFTERDIATETANFKSTYKGNGIVKTKK